MTSLLSISGKRILTNEGFMGNCSRVDNYSKIGRIGEGTYGIVYKGQCQRTGAIVALKRIRSKEESEGIPLSSLREIAILKRCRHENIVQVLDVVVGSDLNSIFLVMEYANHDFAFIMDEIIDSNPKKWQLNTGHIKCLIIQLLQGVSYLHGMGIIHRDLKMSNLLLTSKGMLKIADFGLCRAVGPSMTRHPRAT